jgi:hypothetical protein
MLISLINLPNVHQSLPMIGAASWGIATSQADMVLVSMEFMLQCRRQRQKRDK